MEKKISDKGALSILSATVIFFFVGIMAVKANSTVVLIAAGTLNIGLAMLSGVRWNDLNEDICQNISTFIPAILVIIAVGMVVGAWIISGTIPLMIYYGLKMLSPSWFLIASLLICIVISVATGTSWGTIGTVGIALMGVSGGLGIPLHYTAGAVVSGAIFGDKISPLSDTTILASAVSDVYIYEHMKYLLLTTIPPMIFSVAMYWFLGRGASGTIEGGQLEIILSTLEKNFSLDPVLILPPITVLLLVAMQKPALPTFAAGIIIAVLLAVVIQDAGLKDISSVLYSGYTKTTGVEIVDKMILRGGLKSMLGTVAILLAAAVFGSPLKTIGVIDILVRFVRKRAKTGKVFQLGMFFVHSFLFIITGSYYVTFSVFGPSVRSLYDEFGLNRINLSRLLEDTGTAFAPVIPWSVTGAFCAGTLNVPTSDYILFSPITYGAQISLLLYIIFDYKIANKEGWSLYDS